MGERDDIVTENTNIEDLPLSCAAVSYLKSKNINKIKDLKSFNIGECRLVNSKMADEISKGIEPYLKEFCDSQEKSQSGMPVVDATIPDRVISPFLGIYLTKEELENASFVPLQSLNIARFKLAMKQLSEKNITTVGDIIKIPPIEMLQLRGVGRGRLSIFQATIKTFVLRKRGKRGAKLGTNQSGTWVFT